MSPAVLPDADQVRHTLGMQGFLLLPGMFGPRTTDAIRAELDDRLRAEAAAHGAAALAEIGQQGYVADVLAMGPATRQLLDSDVIHGALVAALGSDPRLSIAQGIALEPGQGRGQWPRRWHADLFAQRLAIPDPAFCFGLNCLVMVDEMRADNGATCLIPASHGYVEPRSDDASELEALSVSMCAPAGSVLLLDAGIWHAAGHNTSTARRRALKLLFVRPWIRAQLDYRRLLAAGGYDDVPPRLARKLGLSGALDPVVA